MKKFKKISPKNKEIILKDDYKDKIANASHLGKKGYTILKSELTMEDLQFLKNDLHVKPQNFSIKSNAAESSPFSVDWLGIAAAAAWHDDQSDEE